MAELNKTEIRLEIDKTIQPKQFEPIKVIVDIKESFYWKDEVDREKKIESYTSKLTENFVKTFNQAVTRIGEEDRCIGKVITGGDVPIQGAVESSVDIDNDDDFIFD